MKQISCRGLAGWLLASLILVACAGPTTQPAQSTSIPETSSGQEGAGEEGQLPTPPEGENLAEAGEVTVMLGRWYVDEESRFLNVFGTVTNNSDAPITGQVALLYYDSAGQPITASVLGNEGSDSIVFTAPIPPGETGYFFRPRDLSKLESAEISEVKAELWYAIKEEHSPLGEFSNTESGEGEDPTYSGSVTNVGDATCTTPAVEVAYLDGEQLIYLDSESLGSDLEPGGEAEFAGETLGSDVTEGYSAVTFALSCGTLSFER